MPRIWVLGCNSVVRLTYGILFLSTAVLARSSYGAETLAVLPPMALMQNAPAYHDFPAPAYFPSSETASQDGDPFHDYPELGDYYVPWIEPSYMDQGVNYLLDSRSKISSAVSLMGERMDAYFAGEQYWDDDNNTYLRLRLRPMMTSRLPRASPGFQGRS